MKKYINPDVTSEGRTLARAYEAQQVLTMLEEKRALTSNLMEQVCSKANLNQAYKRVMKNKGAAGVDNMTVKQLFPWIKLHKEALINSLLEGEYKPKPVRNVDIPKATGGTRQLGIPTVVDRLIQQAMAQVLEPILDPSFSESSYGFRPGRSAHQALRQASRYVQDDKKIVVDIDLESFFDSMNHDILMSRLARRIEDKRFLKLTRKFLQSGMMRGGMYYDRHEGAPQGGPLSPILSNLLLDDLDKELEKRGHSFCRYADDCNIYVSSQTAGERVMHSITKFLEKKLKLRVNQAKSAVALVEERQFLGYKILYNGKLDLASRSVKRIKDRIRQLTKRNRGLSLEDMIKGLNQTLIGWVNYFRYASPSQLNSLDGWIRRKVRCYRLKQRKRSYAIATWLMELRVPERRAWLIAKSSLGWWRLSATPPIHEAMSLKWFKRAGLVNLFDRAAMLHV